jgi:hypothetical protein
MFDFRFLILDSQKRQRRSLPRNNGLLGRRPGRLGQMPGENEMEFVCRSNRLGLAG